MLLYIFDKGQHGIKVKNAYITFLKHIVLFNYLIRKELRRQFSKKKEAKVIYINWESEGILPISPFS